MDIGIVTIAAIVCAILSGIDVGRDMAARNLSLLPIGVFILSLAIALSGLGVVE